MSTFGATTVRSRGWAKAGAWLNKLSGALPRLSGALTDVFSRLMRRKSISGKP